MNPRLLAILFFLFAAPFSENLIGVSAGYCENGQDFQFAERIDGYNIRPQTDLAYYGDSFRDRLRLELEFLFSLFYIKPVDAKMLKKEKPTTPPEDLNYPIGVVWPQDFKDPKQRKVKSCNEVLKTFCLRIRYGKDGSSTKVAWEYTDDFFTWSNNDKRKISCKKNSDSCKEHLMEPEDLKNFHSKLAKEIVKYIVKIKHTFTLRQPFLFIDCFKFLDDENRNIEWEKMFPFYLHGKLIKATKGIHFEGIWEHNEYEYFLRVIPPPLFNKFCGPKKEIEHYQHETYGIEPDRLITGSFIKLSGRKYYLMVYVYDISYVKKNQKKPNIGYSYDIAPFKVVDGTENANQVANDLSNWLNRKIDDNELHPFLELLNVFK